MVVMKSGKHEHGIEIFVEENDQVIRDRLSMLIDQMESVIG